jgi:heat shock protein 90kDa beta
MGDTSSLDFMRSRKVFEINPEHEIIKGLNVSTCLPLTLV